MCVVHAKSMTGAPQFSLSDALTAEVMVAARKLSVASAKAAAEIYTSVSVNFMIFAHLACIPVILQDTSYEPLLQREKVLKDPLKSFCCMSGSCDGLRFKCMHSG